MAIITVYVRSPISGFITGRTNYCKYPYGSDVCLGSGGVHGTCIGGSSPIDIGGSGSLNLHVNYPNILSIRTFVEIRCCPSTYGNDYRRTITVELYGKSNGLCYVGSVKYAHVASPAVSNNTLYNLTSGTKLLGAVPAGNPGSCYTGPHSHMERVGGSVMPTGLCCGATVNSSTNVYKYTWDNALPCPS